jgi:hypothetical protein
MSSGMVCFYFLLAVKRGVSWRAVRTTLACSRTPVGGL